MIAPHIGFTGYFSKTCRIGDYDQLRKMSCGIKRQARACTIHAKSGLKLPDDVKQLAITAARHQGISPHAFMVGAIRTAATNAEKRAEFVADAVAARTEAVASGEGYMAKDVHAYLRARAHGKPTNKPKAKAWRK